MGGGECRVKKYFFEKWKIQEAAHKQHMDYKNPYRKSKQGNTIKNYYFKNCWEILKKLKPQIERTHFITETINLERWTGKHKLVKLLNFKQKKNHLVI